MGYVRNVPQQWSRFVKCAVLILGSVLVASICSAQAAPESRSTQSGWADELNEKYPGLLNEFGQLFDKLQKNVPFPAARGESRILPVLPESTIAYGAIPNYGDTSHQALKAFQQELQDSKVLADWWKHGDMATEGPKLEDSLEKFYQVSQYLGDEIVLSAAMDGKEPRMLIVAEIKKPGLKAVLQKMEKEISGKSKSDVRVVDPVELAALESKRPVDELLLLVRPDFIVGATDLPTLRNFNARLDRGTKGFETSPFGQRVAQAYQGGITLVGAADVHKMLEQVPPGKKQDQESFQSTGFADMKYLVWQHTTVAGQGVSESELSFMGSRKGAAAWLAKPGPLGSLDFVSPKALFAGTLMLTSPAQIFEDVKAIESISNPNAFATLTQAEQGLKLTLKDDLLSYLGGEITLELDNINPPKPEWKAILKVTDAKRLQQTMGMLLTASHFGEPPFDEGEITYYPVKIPSGKATIEINYAYVDGYLIIGSSHETVVESIRLHKSGEPLGRSKKFLMSVPPDRSANASGMIYQDPVAMAALRLQPVAPEIARYLKQAAGKSTPGVMYLYGEDSSIKEASRGGTLDVAAVLIVAAIAIPNLLKSRIAANEASAVGSLRTVNLAQVTYTATFPDRGFAPNLAALGPDPRGPDASSPQHGAFLDDVLGNASCSGDVWCKKSGYNFRLTATCKLKACKAYVVVATRVDKNTGTRSFCSTSDGVIRFKTGDPLTVPVSAAECRTWEPLK